MIQVAEFLYVPSLTIPVKALNLQQPIYRKTASYGHFGNPAYTWEQPKQLNF